MTKTISRRNMLARLSALPLLSAISIFEQGCWDKKEPQTADTRSDPDAHPDLYVWLHGLFTLAFHRDCIVLLTPSIAEHSYAAGDWGQEKPLVKGEWYRLFGVSDPQRPDPSPRLDPTKNAIVSGVQSTEMEHSYFLMRLPFPKEIIPIRFIAARFSGSSSRQFPAMFPMVQILKYKVFDRNNLKFEPLDGWPNQRGKHGILNLHIFAEPTGFEPVDHAIAAFDAMVKLLPGADLQLTTGSAFCPAMDNNLPAGLDTKFQMSLAERNGACSKPPTTGGQTGTCFTLIAPPG